MVFISPDHKALFPGEGYVRGGWLISHEERDDKDGRTTQPGKDETYRTEKMSKGENDRLKSVPEIQSQVYFLQTWICFFWGDVLADGTTLVKSPPIFHHHQRGEFLLVHFLHPRQRSRKSKITSEAWKVNLSRVEI